LGKGRARGSTERGAINDNVRRAVEAAIADTTDKWATYRELQQISP
jgi:hypothetical protein